MDSGAALAMSEKRGLGRKHVKVQHLWLQDAVRKGRLKVGKIGTAPKSADLMTKGLGREQIDYFMGLLNYSFEG